MFVLQNYKLMRTKCHKTVSKSSNVTKTKLIVTFFHVHSTFELYHFKILKKLPKMDVPDSVNITATCPFVKAYHVFGIAVAYGLEISKLTLSCGIIVQLI